MLKKFVYILWILIFVTVSVFFVKNGNITTFINAVEGKTFDIRQNILSSHRINNKDIVIIAVDDASYEYILDHYGEWPLKRDVYSNLIDLIEQQNPKSIAFDFMFVKSMKSTENADQALIESFKKYNNIFTAMNFDNQPQDLRIAQDLPQKLAVKVDNKSNVDLDFYEYTNCRMILSELIDATSNIGLVNVIRGDDGVLREMPAFLSYKGKYYPQLAVKVAMNYMGLDDSEFLIDKDGNLLLSDDKKIQIKPNGGVILNWYGPAQTFTNIPIYKLLKSMNEEKPLEYDFNGKIVYVGATASSLFDIKTTPVDRIFPGVEVQATYVNNLIDGSAIKKTSKRVNIIVNIILPVFTILAVCLISSVPFAFGVSLTGYLLYIVFTYYVMARYNVWMEIVTPLIFAIISFIAALIIKYLIKSKNFDYQYKLATTDGLTELYNHRYFQEQMQMFTSSALRYDSVFSLIMLDIDYFKRFNDTYGHQSGDAVLKQVAYILKKNVRMSDIVCRYGGEEISIILPNTPKEDANAIANKLCKLVSEYKFKLSAGRESNVTISLGVAQYGTEDGTTPAQIIESADKRLYEAKNNGRNRVN